VSAKYAAIGRAAAAETAAAQEAARKEQQRQQQLQQDARRAAAAALQDETDSEHEVNVIITTSPTIRKGGNMRSSLRSSAEAACAAAVAARAAALRNSASSSPARVQYLPEAAMAGKLGTGSSKSSSTRCTVSVEGSSKLPKSLRDLINKQKQNVPLHPKHDKSAAGVSLRSNSNSGATASRGAMASMQPDDTSSKVISLAKGSSKRRPGKPAVEAWLPHADAGTAASCAATCNDQQVCDAVLSELAAAAEQGAAAARSTRQALLAQLLEEWSHADLVRQPLSQQATLCHPDRIVQQHRRVC
jgi:hypothetical protein